MRIAALLVTAVCLPAAAQLPVEAFFKPSAIESASISPSGRHIALVAANKEGHHQLVTMDTQTLTPRSVASLREANVTNVHWVNDRRLVFQIVDTTRKWTEFTFPVAMYAVDHDGENYKYLVRFPEDHTPDAPVQDARMRFRAVAGGDEIFVSRWFGESGKVEYVGSWRLDTRNGRLHAAEANPTDAAPKPTDAELQKVQARIDATLPATTNRIDAPLSPQAPMLLVFAFSDRDPGRFYLYDRAKDKLVTIGRRRPDMDPEKMARREFVNPFWVTTPADGKQGARPAVILVGTRSVVREWDAPTQWLASRGYAVVEAPAGREEAARWAIAKAIADPDRIVDVTLPAADADVDPLQFWTRVERTLK